MLDVDTDAAPAAVWCDRTRLLQVLDNLLGNAMKFAQDLVTQKAAPQGAEGPLVATLFNEGRAATVISGPWFTGDIAKGLAGKWKVAEAGLEKGLAHLDDGITPMW